MSASTQFSADPRRWLALVILLLAKFLNLLDITSVNVALPSIQESTGASFATLQWVVAGYLLVFALGLLPGGRLGDQSGHKKVFLVGVAVFTLASVLCGLAPDGGALVIARLIQGAGTALMVPQALAIIHMSFEEKERAAAFGMAGAVAGLAVIVGPVLAGGLIALDFFGLGWRWIYLSNIPVGLFVLFKGKSVLPETEGNRLLGMDLKGVCLSSIAVLLFVFPTIQSSGDGWSPWLAVTMVSALPVMAFFVWLQSKQDSLGQPTLMPPRLFSSRSFSAGVALAFTFYSGVAGFFLVFALYLQNGLGHSALEAGLALLPFALGAFLASAISAMRKGQANQWLLALGSAVMAAGMASLMLVLNAGVESALVWPVLAALALAGAGMGVFVVNMFDFSMLGVSNEDAGAASGVLHTSQQLGNAAGIAVIGAVFFGTLTLEGTENWGTAIGWALWFEIGLYSVCTAIALASSAGRRGVGRPQPHNTI